MMDHNPPSSPSLAVRRRQPRAPAALSLLIATVLGLALLLLVAPSACVAAAEIEGRLTASEVLPDLSLLPPNTRVVLDGGAQVAYIDDEGTFVFPSVSDGPHLLEVIAHGYLFDKIRLTVTGESATASIHLDGTSWSTPGPAVSMPLTLPVKFKANFFVPREGFNLVSMIMGNPMMLMMGASLVMFFFLPKMMSGMDPETLKEIQDRQQSQRQALEMPDISQNLANWLAPSTAAAQQQQQQRKK